MVAAHLRVVRVVELWWCLLPDVLRFVGWVARAYVNHLRAQLRNDTMF
jgi:hypothetical protein